MNDRELHFRSKASESRVKARLEQCIEKKADHRRDAADWEARGDAASDDGSSE